MAFLVVILYVFVLSAQQVYTPLMVGTLPYIAYFPMYSVLHILATLLISSMTAVQYHLTIKKMKKMIRIARAIQ